jgi:hypothetical protein
VHCTATNLLQVPKSRRTIVTASKRANSRFFTDCYPISAVFRPKVNQIAPPKAGILPPIPDHEIDNLLFNISCLMSFPLALAGKNKGPGQAGRDLLPSSEL